MTSLRKQIEALADEYVEEGNLPVCDAMQRVLAIIDAHECYDRDRLARALGRSVNLRDSGTWLTAADAIIAALESDSRKHSDAEKQG